MLSLIILSLSLLIEVGLQRVKAIPANAHSTLGTLILYVPLPAVCLLSVPHLEWSWSQLSVILVTWIVFGVGYFFFTTLGKKLNWSQELTGCMILTGSFCNSSFVGFPVIEALYGAEGLKHAVLLDLAGSFLIVSSFGVWVAIRYSSGQMKKRILFKKILFFPPFIALLAGIILGVLGWKAEGITREVLERLALLLTPLALISVGLQLKWGEVKEEFSHLVTGLSFKLILAPLIIFTLYYSAGVSREIFQVAVMESAMAPMITASILAASHNLRPRLAGMMIGVGVPLSFITLGLWYTLLNFL